MGTHFTHSSFAAGELSPKTLARTDLERRHVGVERCRNFRVMKEGGLELRPGQRFRGKVKFPTENASIYKFERDATAAYMLEFGRNYMRVWKDHALVNQSVDEEDPGAVHIDDAAVYDWTISTGGTDEWYLELDGGGGDPGLAEPLGVFDRQEGPPIVAAALTKGVVGSLAVGEWGYGDNDTLGFTTIYVRNPTSYEELYAQYLFELVTPFTADDASKLVLASVGDLTYITHKDRTFSLSKITRLNDGNWTLKLDVSLDNADLVRTGAHFFYEDTYLHPTFQTFSIKYFITALYEGVDGGESLPDTLLGISQQDPEADDNLAWQGVQWQVRVRPIGDEKNIIIPMSEADYDWIELSVYNPFPAGVVYEDWWFLVKKGTGTDFTTNPAQDPEIFLDRLQVAPAMATRVDTGAIVARVRPGSEETWTPGFPPPAFNWLWGSSQSLVASNPPAFVGLRPSFGIVPFNTLWSGSDGGAGVKPDIDSVDIELHLEFAYGYNVYRQHTDFIEFGPDELDFYLAPGLLGEVAAHGGGFTGDILVNDLAESQTDYDDFMRVVFAEPVAVAVDIARPPPEALHDLRDPGMFFSHVTFFNQRLCLLGQEKTGARMIMSRPGEFESFAGLGVIATPAAPIDRTLTTVSPIRGVASENSLLVFTEGEEWRVYSTEGGLTPETIDSVKTGQHGTSLLVEPLLIENLVLFAGKLDQALYAIEFDVTRDRYLSDPLSAWSDHLLMESPIISWAYVQEPDKTVYAPALDGGMLSVTFEPQQQVNGWAKHATAEGSYEDAESLRSGSVDELWVLVRRDGELYIETLDDRQFARIEDAFFVDSGLSLELPEIAVQDIWVDGEPAFIAAAHGLGVDDVVQLQIDNGRYATLDTLLPGDNPVGNWTGAPAPVANVQDGRDNYHFTTLLIQVWLWIYDFIGNGEGMQDISVFEAGHVWVYVPAASIGNISYVSASFSTTVFGEAVELRWPVAELVADRWNRLTFNPAALDTDPHAQVVGGFWDPLTSPKKISSFWFAYNQTGLASVDVKLGSVEHDAGEANDDILTSFDGFRFKVSTVVGTDYAEFTNEDGTPFVANDVWLLDATITAREPVTTISNLDHLIGRKVAILADGREQPRQYVDSNGEVQVPDGCVKAHVGLPIEGEIVLPSFAGAGGDRTLVGAKKSLNEIFLQLLDTKGLQVGPSFDDLVDLPLETDVPVAVAQPLFTGELALLPFGAWTDGGQVHLKTTSPLPATILAITPDYEVGR